MKNARQVTGSLAGWLHRVAVGKSVDLVRNDMARRRREQDYAALPRETDQRSEISPLVDEALLEIDEEARDLLVRHYLLGETLTDIAAVKGISQPTVSRRAEQALEQLRARLKTKGVLVTAFALSGVLAAAVAFLFVAQSGTLTPRMSLQLVVIAFVGTAIGGLGSLVGAAVGGFLVGAASVILQAMLPPELRDFREAFAFALVILVLLVRPQGLFPARGLKERV